MICIWSITSFNFYLISYQLKYSKGNLFINSYLTNITQIAGSSFGGVVYSKMGMKFTCQCCYGISLFATVLMMSVGNSSTLLNALNIIFVRFACSSMFNVVYLANSEIFPPLFSSTIFGICNTFSRILTILAPMVAELQEPIPKIIFTVFSFAGIIVPNFLILEMKVKSKKE